MKSATSTSTPTIARAMRDWAPLGTSGASRPKTGSGGSRRVGGALLEGVDQADVLAVEVVERVVEVSVHIAFAGGPALGGSGRGLVGRGAGEGADSLADDAGHAGCGSPGCRDAGWRRSPDGCVPGSC